MDIAGLFPGFRDSMNQYPVSRDWYLPNSLYLALDCCNNTGDGRCAVLSNIGFNKKHECTGYVVFEGDSSHG